MDANGMRARFLLGYEAARLAARTFNDREIQDFLNKAQLELIKQRFAAFRNNKQSGYGGNPMIPQSTTVRGSELAGLLSGTKSIDKNSMIKGTKDNGALQGVDGDSQYAYLINYGWFVPIPDEAMYLLMEEVNTTRTDGNIVLNKYNVPALEVTYDYYRSGIYDFYAKPYDNLVWVMDWGTYKTGDVADGVIADSTKTRTATGNVSDVNMRGYPDTKMDGENFRYLTTANPPVAVSVDPYDPAAVGFTQINTRRSRYLIPGKDWKVGTYRCSYLKRPSDVKIDVITPANQINCELADFLHQEIVDYAVKLASAAIMPEQGKYQVNQIESKEDE
jgi:hypothetical protein